MTSMPRVLAQDATTCPMRPHPMMPSVFPLISTPMRAFLSHLPSLALMSAAGSLRARLQRSDTASCAVLTVLPPGVFITITPYLVASATLMLSTPTPALPMTRLRGA